MSLPLRLSVSFRNWDGDEKEFLHIFKTIGSFKLFGLELDCDASSLEIFLKNKEKLTIDAFHKTIIVHDIESLRKLSALSSVKKCLEIPFYYSLEETQTILSKLEKQIQDVTLSYFLTSTNIKIFEYLLTKAKALGIKEIVIPNPDLVNFSVLIKDVFLTEKDLNKLTFVEPFKSFFKFQVHDYFLAKYLNLEDASLFKGCQAGSLVGYIQNGTVFTCKSIPIALGSITKEDFKTVWEKAKDVMKTYKIPTECKSCSSNSSCNFGCPGTAFFLNNGIKDPLCER